MFYVHNVENWKCVALKKWKFLSSVSKEKFLKGDGVKHNQENVMKSNDGIPCHHGSDNEGTWFFSVIL